MNEVHAEVSRLIKIGATHDKSLLTYKRPRLEEWFQNTAHIHTRLENVEPESLGRKMFAYGVEFTERHNGTLAVWARLQAAEVELVDLMQEKREQSVPALARVGLTDLRAAMDVKFMVAKSSIERGFVAQAQ